MPRACRYCGQEIVFRRIDGETMPIHTTGYGCSGGGGGRRSQESDSQEPPQPTNLHLRRCHYCEEDFALHDLPDHIRAVHGTSLNRRRNGQLIGTLQFNHPGFRIPQTTTPNSIDALFGFKNQISVRLLIAEFLQNTERIVRNNIDNYDITLRTSVRDVRLRPSDDYAVFADESGVLRLATDDEAGGVLLSIDFTRHYASPDTASGDE